MSGQRGTPSRASSFSSVATNESQNNAALLGAALAYGRPRPKSKGSGGLDAGAGGRSALAAASRSGARSRTPSPEHDLRKDKRPGPPGGRGSTEYSVRAAAEKARGGLGRQHLVVPGQLQKERSKAPSQYAAQLAAARSSEPVGFNPPPVAVARKPPIAPKSRTLLRDQPTDVSHIPSTTSLVELFEREANGPRKEKRPAPITIRPTSDLAIRSPKPIRTSEGGISSVFQMELDTPKATPPPSAKVLEPLAQYDGQSSDDDYVSASEDTADASPLAVRKTRSFSESGPRLDSQSHHQHEETADRPSTSRDPTFRRSIRPTASPHVPIKPMNTYHAAPRAVTSPPVSFAPSAYSTQSIAAQWHQLHPRRATPLQSGDDLANAIVASSLASSRARSPQKVGRVEPPAVPTRRRHHTLGFSRTPSPAKHGMKHTLRKAEPSDSEAEDELHPYGKHKKKRLVRKHPNKHHEGDRKRWRDAVTERERKRYEGVWAANKGLHCSLTPSELADAGDEGAVETSAKPPTADQVSNIVARDIWSRSRLPVQALEIVWDLVDNAQVGRLEKEEFVVGMWLIDQRLKGRKLPMRVSESVWASVRSLQGIKIRK